MKSKLCFSAYLPKVTRVVVPCGLCLIALVGHSQPMTAPNLSGSFAAKPPSPAASTAANNAIGIAAAAPTATVTVPSRPLTPPSYLSSLETSNGFDAQRKMWPDRKPPPTPPPPPPPPPPVTDKDLQLYGVVIVGQTKRATIKVGSRFAQIDTQGRGFVSVSEGQVLGEWTLSEIHPTHLVLGAPGGQQTVMFNKKTDRVATAGLQPMPSTPSVVGNEPSSNALTTAAISQQPADNNASRPAGGVPATATAATGGPVSAPPAGVDNTIKNAQPGSLAAAISAAQAAAAAAPPSQNVPPPANFNPFLQLFPK